MSELPQGEHYESMPFAERLTFFFVGVVPPLVVVLAVLGGATWMGLGHDGGRAPSHGGGSLVYPLVLGLGVAAFVGSLWLMPALKDFLAGKVLVAEGQLAVMRESRSLSDGTGYLKCSCAVIGDDPTRRSGHFASPRCRISLVRSWFMRRHESKRARLYIAPHSSRLLHWKVVGPAPAPASAEVGVDEQR